MFWRYNNTKVIWGGNMNNKKIKAEIKVKDNIVGIVRVGDVEYISLTDLARYKNPREPGEVIIKWMSNKSSFDFYCLWEELFNADFKVAESRHFKNDSANQSFTMSPSRWIKETNAKGFVTKRGKYDGGTYSHPDIAFEFASWISPEFKLYLITEFERLKKNEYYQKRIEWSVRRELAKTNYKIHTDSIKENLIPTLTESQRQYVYANEADVLNVALFGITAKEFKQIHPELEGNLRDYANILQLIILSNLENLNSEMVACGIPQKERLDRLNKIAKRQFEILNDTKNIKEIETISKEIPVTTTLKL